MLFVVQDREKENITMTDLPHICRFCLRSDYLMRNIFETNSNEINSHDPNDPLPKKIKRSFQLDVIENDGLPSQVCFRCISRIDVYTEYRDKCIENDQILRSIVSYSDIEKYIKKEDDDIPQQQQQQHQQQQPPQQLQHQPSQIPLEIITERQQLNDLNDHDIYMQAINGLTEFKPDENSLVLVVDPTKDYDSSNNSDDSASENEPIIQYNSQQPTTAEILSNIFLCKFCDKAFTKSTDNEFHENYEHDKKQPYKCNTCMYLFENRNDLVLHIKKVHSSEKPYVCVDCEKGFGRRSDLKKHTIVHTGVRPYVCPVCFKTFSRNTNLTKHIRIHSGHKPFVCPNCPRSFMNKSDLYRHYNVHSDQKLFHCTQCDSKFSRKDKLRNHEKKHLQVDVNDKKDSNILNDKTKQINLLQVVQKPEQRQIDTENMVISLDPYNDLNNQLRANEEQMKNNFIVPSTNIQQQQNIIDYNNYPGHVTGDEIAYSNNIAAYDNNRLLQNRLDNRKFKCDQCPNRFSSKSSLINHKNIHLGIRNHICNICQKAFLRKRELERHSVIHTGIKPFGCLICNKYFGRKDKLIRHERIHKETQNGLYKCTECPLLFSGSDELINHMKEHNLVMNSEFFNNDNNQINNSRIIDNYQGIDLDS